MKILALGALWVPYIRDNWFDALRQRLGDAVTCINAGPLFAARERSGGQPEGFHSAYVYDVLRKGRFDYLFFYHDWIFGDFPDRFFEKVRAAGVRTLAFHPDDEPEHWYGRNSAYDHHFDIVASHSSAGTARRREGGWGERAMYLPWGYNPRSCYPLPGTSKLYDVVFIGKHKIDPLRGVAHVEDGDQREQVLVRLAEACRQRGWTFRIFGHGWERHPTLCNYHGGMPSQEDLVRIYNASRIVFNPAWSSDGNPNGVQTKLRHFEVPGCGAFQITNENPELAELFAAGREIEFYRDDEELLDKVAHYLTHDDERAAIAERGEARARRDHTLDKRVDDLFAHARRLYPAASHTQRPAAVHRLDFSDASAIDAALADAPADAWLHFAGGRFAELQTDYQSVQPFLHALPDSILATTTYIHYAGLADNPLQPKLMETDSALLGEHVDINDFGFGAGGPCPNGLVGVQEQDTARLMINYLVPPGRRAEFLAAFRSGNTAAVDALDALPTGRIVSEVAVLPPPGHGTSLSIRNHEYVRRLRRILPTLARMHAKTVLYGVSGMGEIVLRLTDEISDFALAGIIDRSLKGTEFNGIPVLSPAQLASQDIDFIILAAGASGASIYADIEGIEGRIGILPLYDLNHPAWRLFLS